MSLSYLSDRRIDENPECQANELSGEDVVVRAVAVHGRHLMKDILADDVDVDQIDSSEHSTFICVGSRESDLVKIIEAVGKNQPILLEGPMGAGKTKLVEEVAKMAARKEFRRFHRVYMSDRTDGRSLVGGYSCHDVPGNFNWEDGILTRFDFLQFIYGYTLHRTQKVKVTDIGGSNFDDDATLANLLVKIRKKILIQSKLVYYTLMA